MTTIYLADDHAVLRDGLQALLDAQPGLQVVGAAADGRQAVADIDRLRPDVAIVDIAMPLLNGLDATEQILQCSPATRVVILSMHATSEFVYRALQAGCYGYLLKESAGKELVAAVHAVAAGQRYLSAAIEHILVDDYLGLRQAAATGGPLDQLSAREREVLQLVVEGHSSADIAQQLSLSPKTVDSYRSRLMQKLAIHDLPGLVKFAIQHGLTPLE